VTAPPGPPAAPRPTPGPDAAPRPTPGPAAGDGWAGYTRALGELHAARAGAASAREAARRERAARHARLADLDATCRSQREQLTALATELRAPLAIGPLTPLPVHPLDWPAGDADARLGEEAVDAVLAETRRVGRLPQLLPQWQSQLARATVVYLGWSLPTVVMVIVLTVARARSWSLLLWFLVLWPLIATVSGAITLDKVSLPRLSPDDAALASTRDRVRRYPWMGVFLSWTVYGIVGTLLQ